MLVAGLCTLRLLRANMYYLRAAGVSPGTVGLGTTSGNPPGARRDSVVDQRSPFASGLLSLLLDYAGGVLEVLPDAEQEEAGEEEMDSLRRAVRYEAAEVVGQSLDIFLPEAAQKVGFLTALFHVGLGGDADPGTVDGEHKDEGELEETKTWGDGSGRSTTSSSDEVAIAAAAAMADGPLPVDMDEEGCAALISGICNAICSDPNMLLSLVPEAVRPALTMRDVPSYVAATVRSAEKAQAQAVQQAMLKEAASSSSTSGAPVATPPSGAGATRGSTAPSPRLTVTRGRGSGGGGGGSDLGDGFELWKSGPTVDLPRPGDVVVRGPDWAWGDQDGDSSGRGIVVGLATWGRAVQAGSCGGAHDGPESGSRGPGAEATAAAVERNAVRVMWEAGAINVYRWGAAGESDPAATAGKPCYDLKVLRAPTAAAPQGETGRGGDVSGASEGKATTGGGKTKGQLQGGGKGRSSRGELRWSVEEVEAALLSAGERSGGPGGGSGRGAQEAPTTREVLRFIKNNAPQEWREPRRITGAENALVKVEKLVLL